MRGGIMGLYPAHAGSRRRRSMRGGDQFNRPENPFLGGSIRRRSMRGGERGLFLPVLGGSIRRRSMRGGYTGFRGGPQ
jgi:hypothetical protein